MTPAQPYDVVVVKSATEGTGSIGPALSRGKAVSNTVAVGSMTFTGVPVVLADYCQIWDMRFDLGNNPTPTANTIDAATQQLYADFVAAGGRLYLNGENAGYESRNNGLTQLLTQLGTGAPFVNPGSETGTNTWNIFPYTSDPRTFPTILNNLPGIGGIPQPTVPGWYNICSTCSGWGSSHPLAARLNGGVTEAFMFGFLPSDLRAGVGRVIVAFDWNGFVLFQQVANVPVFQNIYAWLGGCDTRYTVSKTSSVASVNIGSNYSYILCVQNTGSSTLNQILYDTLPACSSFVSSVPTATGHSGQYYWWTPPSITAGTGMCVTVTVQAANLGCP